MVNENKALYWVWLTQCFSVSSPKVIELLDKTDPETFYKEKTAYSFLNQNDMRAVTTVSLERAQMILDRCQKLGVQVITMEDEAYPESLLHIFCPPPVIYVQGSLDCLRNHLVVAAVGSRRAIDYYNSEMGNICYQLAVAGAVIISGCAVGNDTYAHLGCMAGGAPTIGVLACGSDVDYPSKSRELKKQILARGGALVTELPPGTKNFRGYFQARNRLIAGLADCVLLGQVPMRSGAIITAEAAVDQGKEIFCIPPCNISEPACMGVAPFIRDGAKMALSGYDIASMYSDRYRDTLKQEVYEHQMYLFKLAEESPDVPAPRKKNAAKDTEEKKKPASSRSQTEKAAKSKKPASEPAAKTVNLNDYAKDDPRRLILALLTDEPRMIDDLKSQSGLSTSRLLQVLTDMEMDGIIEALSGQRYKLA